MKAAPHHKIVSPLQNAGEYIERLGKGNGRNQRNRKAV